jgi:hypothetical protein
VNKSELFKYHTKTKSITKVVKAYDPINNTNYENVLVGQIVDDNNPFRDYDSWRYITAYNRETVSAKNFLFAVF